MQSQSQDGGISQDHLEKHALQISALHTSLVTLIVAIIAWHDQ